MFENGSVSTDFESEKSLLGVLVAISIPIFTSQLEKSKEATDQANIRSAYAEVSAAVLSETPSDELPDGVSVASGTYSKTVKSRQGDTSAWVGDDPVIGGQTVTCGASWTISGNEADGVSITTDTGTGG